ncbi:MAG: cupredoxin domain-containing protein [Desulfuromonadaceae bacterium]|nr:cupredoxin domain-containing protein [Desulfuromonadaceae bacterium]
MKNSKYYLGIIVILSLCGFTVYAADMKYNTGLESDKAHDHGTWKEKRFVATVDADGVQRVEMVGGNYFYDPNHIVVKVNKPVQLKVRKAAGYIPHDLVAKSPEAGIDFKLELKGNPQTVTFTPTKTGKYPIYCDKSLLWFKTHRERGMEGVIEVVE